MAARAVANVVVAAHLSRAASRSTRPAVVRAIAGGLAALTLVDGAAALALRRAGR